MCKIELDWAIKNKIYYSTALSPFSQYFNLENIYFGFIVCILEYDENL